MQQSRWALVSMLGASALVCSSAHAQVPASTASATPPAPASPAAATPPPSAPVAAAPAKPDDAPASATKVESPDTDAEESDDDAAAKPRAAGSLDVHVRTNQPGVAFYYAKVARPNAEFVPVDWTRMCLGECSAQLRPGYYRFALSYGADTPVMAPNVFQPHDGSRFEGGYTDHSNRRLAGALILGIGGVSSLASMTTGIALASKSYSAQDVGSATLVGGCVGLLVSLLIGIPLAASSDDTSVTPLRKTP